MANRGWPPLRRDTSPAHRAAIRSPATWHTSSSTSGGSSPTRRTCSALPDSSASRRACGLPASSSSWRYAPSTMRGTGRGRRAMNWSSSSDEASAQWRSSRTTTIGPNRAAWSRMWDTPVNRPCRPSSDGSSRATAASPNVQLWGKPGELGQLVRSESPFERLPGVFSDEMPDDLDPRPEAGRLFSVPAGRPCRLRTARQSVLNQTVEQRRLADAGLPTHQDVRGTTSERAIEHRGEARHVHVLVPRTQRCGPRRRASPRLSLAAFDDSHTDARETTRSGA